MANDKPVYDSMQKQMDGDSFKMAEMALKSGSPKLALVTLGYDEESIKKSFVTANNCNQAALKGLYNKIFDALIDAGDVSTAQLALQGMKHREYEVTTSQELQCSAPKADKKSGLPEKAKAEAEKAIAGSDGFAACMADMSNTASSCMAKHPSKVSKGAGGRE